MNGHRYAAEPRNEREAHDWTQSQPGDCRLCDTGCSRPHWWCPGRMDPFERVAAEVRRLEDERRRLQSLIVVTALTLLVVAVLAGGRLLGVW